MRSWIRLIALLYPKSWRQRYGAEFDALLEDATSTWRDAVDVGWGAMEMNLKMWSFPKLAVVCGLAGATLATTMAFRIPNRYLSEARLSVSGDELNRHLFLEQVVQPALSQSFLEELIRKNDLYATGRQGMPLNDAIHRMRSDIHIQFAGDRADPGSFAFVLRYVHRDPVQAQRITDELVASFVRANLQARIANPPGTDIEPRPTSIPTLVTVLGPASRPEATGPNRLIVTAWGIALGLLTAALTALAMRLNRRPAVQT